MLCVFVSTSLLHAQNTFWALDEEDDNRIWGWSDYTSGTSAVDYGRFQYNDGGTWKFFGKRQIEAMALSDSNVAYMLDEVDGLHSYNFGGLSAGSSNIYRVNTINSKVTETGEALAYNTRDGMLYLAAVVGSGNDTDTTADKLFQIDPATGVVTEMGTMKGLGEVLGYTDGLEFNHTTGALYAIDSNDDHLYQINPATGAITAIIDNRTHGGIASDADIETLAWDSAAGRLIGVDNRNDEIVQISLENGNNTVLSNYNSHLGGAKDFEGSGLLPTMVPEPSSAAMLSLAGFVLVLRRRKD